MANPRVFVSSTSFDLITVRSDLEQFMRSMNFEPVLNERGHIPYGSKEKLEEYCYKEIEMCDMLVSIVGGRYGAKSSYDEYSISQKELKRALEIGKQVYIFIDRNVKSEQKVYVNNRYQRDIKDLKFESVDSTKIFDFIDEIESLPLNNTIHQFDTSSDIISFLREQWSGLFKSLLQEASRKREYDKLADLNKTSSILDKLVLELKLSIEDKDSAINDLLLSNHPVFDQIRDLLKVPHRVYFINYREFTDFVKTCGFHEKEHGKFRNYDEARDKVWERKKDGCVTSTLTVQNNVFAKNGKLNIYREREWYSSWVSLSAIDNSKKL